MKKRPLDRSLPLSPHEQVKAQLARLSLASFFRQGWHVLEPSTPLSDNWHIDAVCLHLQSAIEGWQIKHQDETAEQLIQNLIINIPPGTAKSRIVSVYFPAWVWLRAPTWRAIFLSANPRVALRDSMLCRDLIASDWYQRLFQPSWTTSWTTHWEISKDQDAKSNFKNTEGGWRQAMGFFSRITGERGDAVVVDDPHDADEVKSDVRREGVLERWDNAVGNRVNDLRCSLRLGIMQRLHEKDWSGHCLAQGGWEHLCLPMEYEAVRACKCPSCQRGYTAIGWRDPRTQEGDLLFPTRFPKDVLASELVRLTPVGYAGQMQQRPAPKKGSFFKVGKLIVEKAGPAGLKTVRAWDLAATEGSGAFTAGVKMGGPDANGLFWISNVRRGQWATDTRNENIRATAIEDGRAVAIHGPQDPGSGGKDTALAFTKLLAGFTVKTEPISGDKEVRADPFSSQVNAGNVRLVEGDWNAEFIEELRLFPKGTYKDQVDAAADAFAELALPDQGKRETLPIRPRISGFNRR